MSDGRGSPAGGAYASEIRRDLVVGGGSIRSWIETYEEAGARLLTCSRLYKQRERRSRPWAQLGRATTSASDSNTSSFRCPDDYMNKTDQVDDNEVIGFLMKTEIIPLCLRTMEMGSDLSKNEMWESLVPHIEDGVTTRPVYNVLCLNSAFMPNGAIGVGHGAIGNGVHHGVGHDRSHQVGANVLTEPGLCVVFSILQRMMNCTVEFS